MNTMPTARFLRDSTETPCGQWVPLLLEVSLPEGAANALTVDNVQINVPGVALEKDHFRATTLSPGETYRVQLGLRADAPLEVSLERFGVSFTGIDGDPVIRPEPGVLQFDVSLADQLTVAVDTICAYPSGTRVSVRLKHVGSMTLEDFRLAVAPKEAVVAGKCELRVEALEPGGTAAFDLIVRGGSVAFEAAATVRGRRLTGVMTREIRPPAGKDGMRFRFLEPRALSRDDCRVFVGEGRLARQTDGAAVLRSGTKYYLEIAPRANNVKSVELRDIANRVTVRQTTKPRPNVWRFDLDVQFDSVVCEPESLYYAVTEGDGRVSFGEVPICLDSDRLKRFRLASLIGFTLLVQGVVAAVRAWNEENSAVADLLAHPLRVPELWKLGVIPVLWAELELVNVVYYRWRTRIL
jgi:hypothetical protein